MSPHPRLVLPLLGFVLTFANWAVSQDNDPVAERLGLTRESGSLPVWTQPNASSLARLGRSVRDMQQGVVIAGNPQHGFGTGFVISRRHRLIATNAHVADIMAKSGEMQAIVNGDSTRYQVQRIWYHPGLVRCLSDSPSMLARSQDPDDGSVYPVSPDVAVLQLAADGPELPVEFELAAVEELDELFGQPIAMLGYPGHDSHFPAADESPTATYHQGVVSRLTNFQGSSGGPPSGRQFVQHTAAGWGGFSGSPIFLENGRVVALHNMRRSDTDRGATTHISHGIRIDCLWELLAFHDLQDLVPVPLDENALNLARFDQPDPALDNFREAVALVLKANSLKQQGDFSGASSACNKAKRIAPDYPLTYVLLMEISTNYVFRYDDRLSDQMRLQQLQAALDNAKIFLQKVPANPQAVIRYAAAHSNMAGAKHRIHGETAETIQMRREAAEILTRVLTTPGLEDDVQAEAYSHRALARAALEDLEGSLADHNEAIRLDPMAEAHYDNRGEFYEALGHYAEARADQRHARQLREGTAEVPASEVANYRWVDFDSDKGRFHAQFPTTPKPNTISNGDFHHYMFTHNDGRTGIEYLVAYGDLPAEVVEVLPSPEAMLKALLELMLEDGNELISEKTIRLGRAPGHEVEIRGSDGNVLTMRQYAVGKRFYQVAAGGTPNRVRAERANITFFLNAFALVGEDGPAEPPITSTEDDDRSPNFTSQSGRFRVWFPGKPSQETLPDDVFQHHLFMVTNEASDVHLSVEYVDFDAELAATFPTARDRMDLAHSMMLLDEVANLQQKHITLAGRPGIEWRFDGEPPRKTITRVFVNADRMYYCMAEGPARALNSSAVGVDQFLDSFEILDAPKPATPRTEQPRTVATQPDPPQNQPPSANKTPRMTESPSEKNPEWTPYTSFAGGFRATFPGPPEEMVKQGDDYTHHVCMTSLESRQMGFVVTYADLPEELRERLDTPGKCLDFARDKAKKDGKVRVERKLKLAGHAGRDIEIETSDGGVMFARMFMVDDRLYQIVAVGPVDQLHFTDPNVRRFIDSFALTPIITDAGKLAFGPFEMRQGRLGPVRESPEVFPHDPIDFHTIVSGVLTDGEGCVDIAWRLKLTDKDGETLVEGGEDSRVPLGTQSSQLPFCFTVTPPPEPGKYTVSVSFHDKLSGQTAEFETDVTVKPVEFAVTALRFFYDEEGNTPAPASAVAGQYLFAKMRAIGFDRSQGQVDVVMSMQLIDGEGKPVLPRAISAAVTEEDPDVVQQVTFLTFDARLPLDQAGDLTLRITLFDRVGNNFAKFETELRVHSP